MFRTLRKLKNSNRQTKFFILMAVIYMFAMLWTTIQAYSRLSYSRSDAQIIVIPNKNQS